jgi:hypothetical protein
MSDAAGLTLAAVLALTARFHAGVEAMKAGNPSKAAAEMSAVIRAEPGLPDLAHGARFLRGQALMAWAKREEALDDFRWLATRNVPPDIRKQAREEFVAAGGKPESLAPELPPLAEWKRLQEAIREGEGRKAWDWMSEQLRRDLKVLGEMMGDPDPDSAALWFAEEDSVLTGQVIDDAAGTARLTFREDEQTIHVDWVQDGSRWRIARLRHEAGAENIPLLAVTDEPPPSGDRAGASAASGADAQLPALPPGLKAEIEQCLVRLGAADATVRARARTRLKEIGESAWPMLRQRANDPDPEIATTVRELLARP